MKIGFLADIHSNLPALEAVLKHGRSVDLWVCAGDFVGYYSEPDKICELARTHRFLSIRGNHDAYVIGALAPNPSRLKAYRTDWTRAKMKSRNLAWLRSLPTELILRFDQKTIRIRHANPWDEETYLYKDSPLLKRIKLKKDELLVLGHTHHPMLVKRGKGLILNPGSVGQPRDYNPASSYAVLDQETGKISFKRVRYEHAGLQKKLKVYGWDPRTIEMLDRKKIV